MASTPKPAMSVAERRSTLRAQYERRSSLGGGVTEETAKPPAIIITAPKVADLSPPFTLDEGAALKMPSLDKGSALKLTEIISRVDTELDQEISEVVSKAMVFLTDARLISQTR